MARKFKEIISLLPEIRKRAADIRDIIVANLVMIGEVPAPTFGEQDRINLIQQRFSESGLQNCSTDEAGNALGVIPGEVDNNILLVAHADTVFPATVDHTISLKANTATGPGVADNGISLAVLVSLQTLLEHLDISFNTTLFLMAASRSLGRGNLEGLTFFLSNRRMPVRAGICLEGIKLGRLSISSVGLLRGEVQITVPEEYDWTRFGAISAIHALNEVINGLNKIRLPKRPRSSIVLGAVEGGKSFHTIARQAVLRFEIRSESAGIVREIRQHMNDIAAEVASKCGAEVKVKAFARRKPGGIAFAHPLSRNVRSIMRALKISPRIAPGMAALSAFTDRQIPAVTIGLTDGEHLHELDETIQINKTFTGIAQLIGILLAIDGGFCDED